MNQTNVTGNVQVEVVADEAELARNTAQMFVERAGEAATSRGMCYVALSGGNTPRALYELLASEDFRDRIDWSLIQIFFSDERFVPADSPESNFRMATDTLLSHVPINERFVHRVATEDIPADAAAANYEEGIRRVFAIGLDETPRFDLILLGLGTDGHTASLFPDTEALSVDNRLVVPNFVPKLDAWRISFTYPLINAARCVSFLVSGEDKAEIVRRVMAGDSALPASHVKPESGDLIWHVGSSAATRFNIREGQAATRAESTDKDSQ